MATRCLGFVHDADGACLLLTQTADGRPLRITAICEIVPKDAPKMAVYCIGLAEPGSKRGRKRQENRALSSLSGGVS